MLRRQAIIAASTRHSWRDIVARRDARDVLTPDGTFDVERHRHRGPVTLSIRQADGTARPLTVPPVLGGAAPALAGAAEIIAGPTNPTDYGATVDMSSRPLFPDIPGQVDVKQGQNNCCFIYAAGGSIATNAQDQLRSLITKISDGLYDVRYTRSGQVTHQRTDGQINTWFTPLADDGALWPAILIKTYAAYRTGANTIASAGWGWSGAVWQDLGYKTVIAFAPTQAGLVTSLMSWVKARQPRTMQTTAAIPAGVRLIPSHEYVLDDIEPVGVDDALITLFNPWAFDGIGSDANPADGIVTILLSAARPGIACFSTAMDPTFPIASAPSSIPAPALTPATTYDRKALQPYYVAGKAGYAPTLALYGDARLTIPGAGTYSGSLTVQPEQAGRSILLNGSPIKTTGTVVSFTHVAAPLVFTAADGCDVVSLTLTPAIPSDVPAPAPSPAPAPVLYSVTVTAPGAASQTFIATKITAVLADGTTKTIPEAA